MRKSVVVALILSIAACSGQPPITTPWMQAYGSDFPQPEPGDAALYIIRDTAPEGAPPIDITMGRELAGTLTSLTWMRFNLPPRAYDLIATGPQGNGQLVITAAPGETRFLLAEIIDPGNAQFLELSPADGRRLVRHGERVHENIQDIPRDLP
jgi:hypothetical protein